MTVLLIIGLGLAVLVAFATRQQWQHSEARLGVMSEQWVAEQSADESRHRFT